LFTKEIEEALLTGAIDIAVHSSKDMPTELPQGLVLSAFLPREDVRDVFIGGSAKRIADLRINAVIGSASLRRVAQLKAFRADLSCINFRGNVQTRLRKLSEGQVDGTLLALAGLNRLKMDVSSFEILPINAFLPALGQGAICIEQRENDLKTHDILSKLDDRETHLALTLERSFLKTLDGSCKTPLAGLAKVTGSNISFHGEVYALDGSKVFKSSIMGDVKDAVRLGREAAEKLLSPIQQGLWRI
jgi:hydroxymethylbilane synthase